VDEQEPRPRLRPQQVAISEPILTDDEWGLVEPLIPPGKDWRWQAQGDHAGGGERPDVHSVDRLSVAARSRKDLPPRSSVYDYFDLWTYDGHVGTKSTTCLYEQCRERARRREAQFRPAAIHRQARGVKKRQEKGGRAIDPARVTMRAKKRQRRTLR